MQNHLVYSVILLFGALLGCSHPRSAEPTQKEPAQTIFSSENLELVWITNEKVENPESAYYDSQSGFIFLSNVAGDADKKDGRGWISKVSIDGKATSRLIDGLNAPKGIRVRDGKLWVSDITDILEIDINSGKILSRISIPEAKFLNDVAIAENGDVYVSDMLANKIYVVSGGKAKVFLKGDSTDAPNGLLVRGNDLIVASWGIPAADWTTKVPGKLYSWNLKTKKRTTITSRSFGNLDGLEIDSKGNYLVSDWMAGKVYRVSPEGKSELLLSGLKGSADIGLADDLLLVPAMGQNVLFAYRLK